MPVIYLWSGTADLADVTVVQLGLLGGPFGLLQLALVEHGLLVGVDGRRRDHVATRVAPGGVGQLFRGLLWWGRLLGRRLCLRWGQLGGLVVGRGGSVASRFISRVVYACEEKDQSKSAICLEKPLKSP